MEGNWPWKTTTTTPFLIVIMAGGRVSSWEKMREKQPIINQQQLISKSLKDADADLTQRSIVVYVPRFLMQSWFMSSSHYSSSCPCAFIGPATMNKWPAAAAPLIAVKVKAAGMYLCYVVALCSQDNCLWQSGSCEEGGRRRSKTEGDKGAT